MEHLYSFLPSAILDCDQHVNSDQMKIMIVDDNAAMRETIQRVLASTQATFYQCQDGQPDFSYRIQDAFQARHLSPYKFATGITRLLAGRLCALRSCRR